MAEFKPWEEMPDDEYWRALLGESASPLAGRNGVAAPRTPTIPTPPLVDSAASENATPRAGTDSRPELVGWALAEKSYTQGDTLELRVIGYNRGGVLVDLQEVRGFVPASQLLSFPRRVQEDERMQELARYVNMTLRLKVIEFDRKRNRLILSERIANPPVSRADQVLATIQPHQSRRGIIRNVTDFGAFVDLGGVEGLIHVSEFSWQHVIHPRDMLSPGQQVQVYIMDVDREQKRIACSIKRLTPNPWMQIAEKLHPGDEIEGVITNVVAFGAFVRVTDAVEGLIHISELAEGSFLHPRDVVHEGQTVRARVISVDPVRQRIGLSLRSGTTGRSPTSPRFDRSLRASDVAAQEQTPLSIRPRIAPSDAPPPPPDAGYWESLAQSGA